MRKRIALILTLSWVISTHSQEKGEPILTESENSTWVTEFKKGDLEARLEKLKKRLFRDQRVFYVSTRNPHGSDKIGEGFEELTYARPLYIFKTKNGGVRILPDNPSAGLIEHLNKILTTEQVSSINYKHDTRLNALYGARARFGVIEINLSQERILNDLEKNTGS